MQLSVRKFDTGVKTKEQIRKFKDCASDRLRAKNVVEQVDNMEIFREDTEYDKIIFHDVDFPELDCIEHKCLKVLDLCDMFWDQNTDIIEFANRMDVIITANEALKEDLPVEKPIKVIGDGHLIHERIDKVHRKQAEWVVWFGYAGNIHCLEPYLETIKEAGLKLRVIADNDKVECDEFIKWTEKDFERKINECDFAILPFNNKYKTNNKDVTSWLCGLPVAKTKEDIFTLRDPWERIVNLSKVDLYQYNVASKAHEYNKICVEYWDLKMKGKI